MELKLVKAIQEWDYHSCENYIWLDGANIVCSCVMEFGDSDDVKYWHLNSVYVQPKYRGLGLTHMILKTILKDYDFADEIDLTVRKGNFVRKIYEDYGFEFYSEKDSSFDWMTRTKKVSERQPCFNCQGGGCPVCGGYGEIHLN